MYILNLAAADIVVSVLSMPVTVVTIVKQHWVLGHKAYVVLGFFTILSFIASVMSLGMIAINRYFYIVKWNTYTNTFSKRKALFYGVAVWVVSISLASLHFSAGQNIISFLGNLTVLYTGLQMSTICISWSQFAFSDLFQWWLFRMTTFWPLQGTQKEKFLYQEATSIISILKMEHQMKH